MNEGEIEKLRDDNAMTILAIPDIVILKAIHVDIQTVRIHVHVDHEMYKAPSGFTVALTNTKEATEYYSGHKSPQAPYTNL
jgi:hypothetical protein